MFSIKVGEAFFGIHWSLGQNIYFVLKIDPWMQTLFLLNKKFAKKLSQKNKFFRFQTDERPSRLHIICMRCTFA